MSILLIDDDLESAMSDYVAALKENGYGVEAGRTTDEAIDKFIGKDLKGYRLVILDMMMPKPKRLPISTTVWNPLRSGGHLLDLLRERAPRLPVLLFSNLPSDDLKKEADNRFGAWCAKQRIERPPAKSPAELDRLLQSLFRVWIEEKRAMPPWALPDLVREIMDKTRE